MSKKNHHVLLGILGGLSILSILVVSLLATKVSVNANAVQGGVIFPCVDTDGGHNLYVQGTVIGRNMQEEDFCYTGDGKIVDQCIGRYCYIMEHYCHSGIDQNKRDGNRIQRQCLRNTPCIRGACVDVANFQQKEYVEE